MSGEPHAQRRPFTARDLVKPHDQLDRPFAPVYRVRKVYRSTGELELVLIGLKPPCGPIVEVAMDDPPRPFRVCATRVVHAD